MFFVFVVVVVNRKFFITCSEPEVSGINVYYLSKTYYKVIPLLYQPYIQGIPLLRS